MPKKKFTKLSQVPPWLLAHAAKTENLPQLVESSSKVLKNQHLEANSLIKATKLAKDMQSFAKKKLEELSKK